MKTKEVKLYDHLGTEEDMLKYDPFTEIMTQWIARLGVLEHTINPGGTIGR